ncbi:hypothetical protein D7X33_35530 [Butyricicoccus sp. 1XD8-22]|nr:hypothetical protein D7X33_35530 [Butyricicoccus sp. 1XD8-22]
MIVKVLFPFTQYPVPYNYTSNLELRKGDLVVVRYNGSEKVGVIYFLESESNERINGKIIRKADTIDRYDFWQEFERLLLKQHVYITDEAFEVYQTTYGNQNIDRELAQRKLTRNLLLSHKSNLVYITGSRMISLQYGAMRLYYRDGMIHKITNKHTAPKGWTKDKFTYDYLGEVLRIDGELVG